MPILGKLKNIFSSGGGENNKKTKDYSFIKQNIDPSEVWLVVKEIGDGAFGKVFKTQHKNQNTLAALKQVPIVEDTDLEDFSIEIEILSQCKHKNIVGLHEAYLYANKLWIYIEFCAGGALDSIIADLERPLTEAQIKFVCREMCEGLNFLHEHGVIHRDIKAGNVLLTHDGNIKLADFGVSAKNAGMRDKRSTFIGSPYWMAPEVIYCETLKDTPYNSKADIWSLGITLIEFAQMHPPNNEMNPMRVLVKIQKSDPPTLRSPSKWSSAFNSFIEKCLIKDPDQRLSAGDLLQHAFIKDVPDRKSIIILLSEINAEVTVETKDVDEDELQTSDHSSETSSLSTSASSNSLLQNDISTSVNKPQSSVATLVQVIGGSTSSQPSSSKSELNISSELPSSAVTVVQQPNAQVVIKSAATTAVVSNFVVQTAVNKTATVGRSSVQVAATTVTKQSGAETKAANVHNSVVNQSSVNSLKADLLAVKSAPAVINLPQSPASDGGTESNQDVRKRYKTMTKTRKYVVDGEVVISQSSKVIVIEDEVKRQQDLYIWRENIHEMKRYQKRDNRVLQNLESQLKFSLDDLEKKFKQDVDMAVLDRDSKVEQLAINHQMKIEKLNISYSSDCRDFDKKNAIKQEQELKEYLKKLQNELKSAKKEFSSYSKDQQKQMIEQKKIENMEKERKYVERQKEDAIQGLQKLSIEHRKKLEPFEREFLTQKHSVSKEFENSAWAMEEQYMKHKYEMVKKHLKEEFRLKEEMMKARHTNETEQIKRLNGDRILSMQQNHQDELRQLSRQLRSEQKGRSQQFKLSIRMSVNSGAGLSAADQEKLQKLELEHKRKINEMIARNDIILKETEQTQVEKQKVLVGAEQRKQTDLLAQHQAEVVQLKNKVAMKLKGVEDDFQRQLVDHAKFYDMDSFTGRSTDLPVTPVVSDSKRVYD